MVKGMEEEGLIRRKRCEEDEGWVLIRVREEGGLLKEKGVDIGERIVGV
ncbi:hypothetical protein [Bacillus subtilis]|nr:hypothetical protein [Bacillus subtilis]